AATNIGPNGSQIKIYSSTINKDSIFLATEIGVLVAAKESNLLNFNNWLLFTSDNGIPTDNVIGVVNYDDSVYALVSSFYETLNNDLVIEGTDKSGLYKYESGNWK